LIESVDFVFFQEKDEEDNESEEKSITKKKKKNIHPPIKPKVSDPVGDELKQQIQEKVKSFPNVKNNKNVTMRNMPLEIMSMKCAANSMLENMKNTLMTKQNKNY
jgi:hypothetical protein